MKKDQDKSSPTSSPTVEEAFADLWPQEREVSFRPERLKYLRRAAGSKECVFCVARDKGPSPESLCVTQTEHAMLILNKYPYNSGHVLVLPKRHVGSLQDFSDVEYGDIMALLRKTARVLEETYECAGMNIGLNHGAVAGAGIPDHLHWHLIPRWRGDTNFYPLIAETKVVPETLQQTYDRLRTFFN